MRLAPERELACSSLMTRASRARALASGASLSWSRKPLCAVAPYLARSPLLLTLMLALAARGEDLPARRTLLYERCTRLLAEDWRPHRPLAHAAPPPTDPRTGEELGADLIVGVLGAAALRALADDTRTAGKLDSLYLELKRVCREEYQVPAPSLEADSRAWLTLALAALGPQLIGAGIPAVIAAQGPLALETAARFTPALFEALQAHGQIDRAVAEARAAVRECPDWWAPALLTILRDGRLW